VSPIIIFLLVPLDLNVSIVYISKRLLVIQDVSLCMYIHVIAHSLSFAALPCGNSTAVYPLKN